MKQVGIKEFREKLKYFIENELPLEITQKGDIVAVVNKPDTGQEELFAPKVEPRKAMFKNMEGEPNYCIDHGVPKFICKCNE